MKLIGLTIQVINDPKYSYGVIAVLVVKGIVLMVINISTKGIEDGNSSGEGNRS